MQFYQQDKLNSKNYIFSRQFKLNTPMSLRNLFNTIAQKTPSTATSKLLLNKEASQAFSFKDQISFGPTQMPQQQ